MTATIEALKDKARQHEQAEEWRKALELYGRAIRKLEEEDRPDITLYNRVGDLFTRVGQMDAAVEHYETAVDLYEEADLPNNAIAVCKKIIRNAPERHRVFLRMGLIRARQGFVVDARENFLRYAEFMTSAGDLDEALRALVEFADLVPEDAEIRLSIASQYEQHDQPDKAVHQLGLAYGALMRAGETEQAREVGERLKAIDESVDLDALATAGSAPGLESTALAGDEDDLLGDLDALGPAPPPSRADADEGPSLEDFEIALAPDEEADEAAEVDAGTTAAEPEESSAPAAHGYDDGDEGEDAIPLPFMTFDDDEEAADNDVEGPRALPLLEGTEELAESQDEMEEADVAPRGEEGAQVTSMEVRSALEDAYEESLVDDEVAEALPVAGAGPEARDEVAEAGEADADAAADPVESAQRSVELAFRKGDEAELARAYMELASALEQTGQEERARSVYQQVVALEPEHRDALAALDRMGVEAAPAPEVASSEDYVDLGALILGEDAEKTTRFVVAYEEPSGDEDADFAKMLDQFKAKVAANVDASDVKAHHDLGTAYKEMGLLDEAIEQFQKALRASADHLATYEALGQAFLDKGTPAAAVRVLTRALDAPWEVEDELLGIYYFLGRAYEEQGNTTQAVEFYDRVFSLDINFADVTERLRALR